MPSDTIPRSPESRPIREPATQFYHPELDVLRFGAFFAVFVAHAFPSEPEPYIALGLPRVAAVWVGDVARSGIFGVTLFFLLSSYLITTLLLREQAASGRLDLQSFYIRRSLRIWPLYFFFLALCFWVLPALGWPHFRNVHKLGFLLFIGNWSMIFFGSVHRSAALLWSVSVEEQFYLFWPLALVVFGFGRLRRMALILLGIATLSRLALLPPHLAATTLWFNTLVQLDPIAIGALLALAFRNGLPSLSPGARKLLISAGLVIPPIALACFDLRGWGMLLTYPLAALGAAAVLAAVLADSPGRWLRGGPLVYLGKISYGLYVYHALMLEIAAKLWPDSRLRMVFAGFGGTVVIAAISYQFLERPFLRLKKRFEHISSRPA
jgi:peptidoglycan/LPS O-acetylase OafA/YrhL